MTNLPRRTFSAILFFAPLFNLLRAVRKWIGPPPDVVRQPTNAESRKREVMAELIEKWMNEMAKMEGSERRYIVTPRCDNFCAPSQKV